VNRWLCQNRLCELPRKRLIQFDRLRPFHTVRKLQGSEPRVPNFRVPRENVIRPESMPSAEITSYKATSLY
jgi:hypothetical protein